MAIEYVDPEGAVNDWINSLTDDLVGVGNPLQLGSFFDRVRSPAKGAYARLLLVGGGESLNAENPATVARISASIYAPTKLGASQAAFAYRAKLRSLDGRPTPMGVLAVCLTVDNIAGPSAIDPTQTSEEYWRYLTDADFHLVLASALTP